MLRSTAAEDICLFSQIVCSVNIDRWSIDRELTLEFKWKGVSLYIWSSFSIDFLETHGRHLFRREIFFWKYVLKNLKLGLCQRASRREQMINLLSTTLFFSDICFKKQSHQSLLFEYWFEISKTILSLISAL